MVGQAKLIDSIRKFSPKREKWFDKPTENLPDKITVTFRSGKKGFLDMKYSKAIQWAKIIDRLAKEKRPVYVDIDEESNIITNLLIPGIFKVSRIDPDDQGNLQILLITSSAIHTLLTTDPDFEAMQAKLHEALNNGSELLITETRDEHEIIDIRNPEAETGGSSGSPPPPPDDPPVSEARALQVYNNMSVWTCSPCNPSSECIPFLYPDDGCWIRAHMMSQLMRTGGPGNPVEDPEKVWISASPGNRLDPLTSNHPDCHVRWGWHVAPTLMVTLPGGNDRQVIDPSLSPFPESEIAWKNRQRDAGASLQDGPWTDYNWYGDGNGAAMSFSQAAQDPFIVDRRDDLKTRCEDFGPPPYSCIKGCFFIIDRSTFSDDEVEAMLHVSSPAVVTDAFYIVVDGFSPYELGFTAPTMQHTPTLNITPNVAGMAISAIRLEFEYPTHLNRRQRLTFVYEVRFNNINGFTSDLITLTLQATISTVSNTGFLYLIRQPNPFENDGATSWLSTDLRVFQINAGQSRFNAAISSDPSAFITQVINNLNSGNTGGQTFENDISVDQQTSRLELSSTVNGTPVFNFAVAKVRYRSLVAPATDVRVFFRLFPVATTSLEYNQATTYRRYTSGSTIVPLLGIKNNDLAAIPCFAAPRINSGVNSMITQTDPANIQTIPADSGGTEVTRYFGCWLDINQTQPQFPITPSPADGPYLTGRVSIYDLIRSEHQCLVSEIAFTPAPAQNGSTPSISDKLAQRNLAIVASANPGLVWSRRVSQTFEIRPSLSKQENDELMIDWGNVPANSIATLYIPGISVNEMILLATKKYRSHHLVRIDNSTLKCATGGITYIPIPFTDGNFPGMITVDLPEGIKKGQVFKVVIKQITDEPQKILRTKTESFKRGIRHVVGSFQLTIPIRQKAEILPGQQRLLSNLRWIEQAIPVGNRWEKVFGRYVSHVADRVDALGGNSGRVAPSASGQWQAAYRLCSLLMVLTVLLIIALLVGSGTQNGIVITWGGIPVIVLLACIVYIWRKKCRPSLCKLLVASLAGSCIAAIILLLLLIFGNSAPQVIVILIASVAIALAGVLVGWWKRCFTF